MKTTTLMIKLNYSYEPGNIYLVALKPQNNISALYLISMKQYSSYLIKLGILFNKYFNISKYSFNIWYN
jgi:hypothetical protein